MSANDRVLDAIQIITDSSIEKAKYDRTIQAQILSCQDATIGKYRCRYQDAIIYAYASSSDITFTNGSYVYILVPCGDMSSEKTILGTTKKLGINYISQVKGDQAYSITGNNTITFDGKFYLNTNNINYKYVIYQYDFINQVDLVGQIDLDVEALIKYIKESSSLIVGATFKTNITPIRQARGHYGITYNLKFLDNTSNQQVIRSYTVDEDSMIDNPYRLIYDTRQYKIFDIDGPNFIGIESIQIFNSGFPNADGTETSSKLTEGDIEISKLEIVGAVRMTESEISSVAISFFTPQGTFFTDSSTSESIKTITAQVRVKGKIASAAQKIPFYWGAENIGITSKSEYYNRYLGRGWKCLNEGNLILKGTELTDPVVEWIPGGDTFILKFSEATAKNNKFKVAIVYDGSVITKEINIQNLAASVPDLTIQSNSGTQFYYDIGHPTLTCKINDTQPEDTLDYIWEYDWAYENNLGDLISLSETSNLNIEYDKILNSQDPFIVIYQGQEVTVPKGLNVLKDEIASGDGQWFENAASEYITILEEKQKEFDYIQRVQRNKIYDVQINKITQKGIFKCSVFKAFKNQQGELTGQKEYLGTTSITLTNTLEGEGIYSLVINNGSAIFQYNENGVAPNSKSLDTPQQIQGLSFTIYDNLGNEIDNNIIINDSKCKVRWQIPIKQTMLVDQNSESSGTDPTLTYRYYDNRVNLIYAIERKYDIRKQRNQIKLTVDYKGMNLTAETNFTFTKQGQSGTNGTQYVVKLVPNTRMNNPPLWPMITKVGINHEYYINYGIQSTASETSISSGPYVSSRQFFKAQLWRSGVKIWEGFSRLSGESMDGQYPDKVTWEILANKYNSSTQDASIFTVSNPDSGYIRNNGYQSDSDIVTTPYANIIKCSIQWQGKLYYGTIPIITAWVSDNKYRINLKDYTGWHYAIYTSDGMTPQYDSSHPFEFIMSEKINEVWEDISLISGDHEVSFDRPVGIGNYKTGTGTEVNANLVEVPTSVAYNTGIKNKWIARPKSRYDGTCVNAAITQVCKDNQNNIIGRISVPIHFLLNKHGLAHINEWDGNSVQVNEEGGFILSPQMGAGTKDNSNNFTGVLMGKVSTADKNTPDIGLLGYADGDRTFFINSQNGSALFGKTGDGQVIIDPTVNRALLYSGAFWKDYDGETGLPSYGGQTGENFYRNYRSENYAPTTNCGGEGMIIDLKTPQIYFGNGNFCVTKEGHIHASEGGDIGGWKIGTEIITRSGVSQTHHILYSNTEKYDGRITLDAGKVDENTGIINGPGKIYSHYHDNFSSYQNGFYLSSEGLSIGWAFKVDNDGNLTAHTGQIGNWQIFGSTLKVGTSSQGITLDAGNGWIKSNNFNYNTGWCIYDNGSAIFNKITARTSGNIAGWEIYENGLGYGLGSSISIGLGKPFSGSGDKILFLKYGNEYPFYVDQNGYIYSHYYTCTNVQEGIQKGRQKVEIGGEGSQFENTGIFTVSKFSDSNFRVYINYDSVTVYENGAVGYLNVNGAYPQSDRRLKTDIKDINPSLAKSLHPVSFKFINRQEGIRYGFIAQEVQDVIPNAVSKGPNDYLHLNYTELIAPLYALVQQQQNMIESLQIKLQNLQKEVKQVK